MDQNQKREFLKQLGLRLILTLDVLLKRIWAWFTITVDKHHEDIRLAANKASPIKSLFGAAESPCFCGQEKTPKASIKRGIKGLDKANGYCQGKSIGCSRGDSGTFRYQGHQALKSKKQARTK